MYLALALVAAVAVAAVLAEVTKSDDRIIWVELAVIVIFCTYWGVQTRELKDLEGPDGYAGCACACQGACTVSGPGSSQHGASH